MRRLYSTFAGSWPGLGLLLMRLIIGSVLLLRAGAKLWNDQALHTITTSAPLAGSGLLLIAGLWTPLTGTVVAIVEIWEIVTKNQDRLVGLLAGTIAGALAMLGPGRWSVDARLFGWKRIEAPPRKAVNALRAESSARALEPGASTAAPAASNHCAHGSARAIIGASGNPR